MQRQILAPPRRRSAQIRELNRLLDSLKTASRFLTPLADKPELAAVVRPYWADRYGIRAGDCPPEPITVVRARKSYRLTIDGCTLTISVVPPLDGGPIGDILESLQIDVSHGSRSMTFLTEPFLDESED